MKRTFVFLLLIIGMVFAMPVIAAPPGEPIAVAMEQAFYVSPLSPVFTVSPAISTHPAPAAVSFFEKALVVLFYTLLASLAGLLAVAVVIFNNTLTVVRQQGRPRARDQPVLLC